MRLRPVTLTVALLAAVGCKEVRPQPRLTVAGTTASAVQDWTQVAPAPAQSNRAVPSSGIRYENPSFLILDDGLDGPGSADFRAGIRDLEIITPSTSLADRAVILARARERFQKAATSSDDDVRRAGAYNVAVASLALGDRDRFRVEAQRVPESSYFPDNLGPGMLLTIPIVLPAAILTWGNWPHKPADHETVNRLRSQHRENLFVHTPGDRFDVKRQDHEVLKEVKPAQRATFAFEDTSKARVEFTHLDVEFVPLIREGRYLDGLSITLANKSQRVIPLTGMAASLSHNRKVKDLKVVNAESRLIPGRETQVIIDEDEQGRSFWGRLKSSENSVSELTLYDVPVTFDDLGNVTRKENLVWKFRFVQGSEAQMARDEEKSTVTTTWKVWTPGTSLLPAP
jgi:hypothetical protein